jgi:hypothetical protein
MAPSYYLGHSFFVFKNRKASMLECLSRDRERIYPSAFEEGSVVESNTRGAAGNRADHESAVRGRPNHFHKCKENYVPG